MMYIYKIVDVEREREKKKCRHFWRGKKPKRDRNMGVAIVCKRIRSIVSTPLCNS